MQINQVTVIKNDNFSVVNNTIARDKRISLKAKGLMLLVLSLPPSWDFSIRGIAAISLEGKDAISTAIQELSKFGYCKMEQVREGGKFKGYNYTFYEVPEDCPVAALPYPGKPDTVKPDTDKPDAENPPQISKDKLNTKEVIKEGGENLPEAPAEPTLKTLLSSPYVKLWQKKTGFDITEAGARFICKRVSNLAAWEDALDGWLANPAWGKGNIDGQINRYDKRIKEGDYPLDTTTAAKVEPELSKEEEAERLLERELIFGKGNKT